MSNAIDFVQSNYGFIELVFSDLATLDLFWCLFY